MTILNRLSAEAKVRWATLFDARERRDAGQGTLEYIGIAVLVGVIMLAIFNLEIGTKITEAFNTAWEKIVQGNG
jgi:Flp pilus assembly pilin Flp